MNRTSITPGYSRCFVGLAVGLSPIFVLCGVAGFFGANTVTFGGRHVYGFYALALAIILNALLAAVFAGLQKLGFAIVDSIRATRKAFTDHGIVSE